VPQLPTPSESVDEPTSRAETADRSDDASDDAQTGDEDATDDDSVVDDPLAGTDPGDPGSAIGLPALLGGLVLLIALAVVASAAVIRMRRTPAG